MSLAPYLSIPKLSPLNPPPEWRQFFVLKAYFDKSSDEKTKQFLTLGGIVASGRLWREFEEKWMAVLNDYGLTAFHMAPAMATPPRRDFTSWPRNKIDDLVKKLLNVMGSFGGPEFLIKSCTIDIQGYERAKAENAQLRPYESICVNFCCRTGLPPDSERPGADIQEVEFYFDVGEDFESAFKPIWSRWKKTQVHPRWVDQIKSVTTASADETPALQAADIVAWIVNGHYKGDERAQRFFVFFGLMSNFCGFYDYDQIKRAFPSN